jgi:predicted TIM-barrel fold metal-dependent hydrolase
MTSYNTPVLEPSRVSEAEWKAEAALPTYDGPIFDGDTHLYEAPDAWSRYLPEKFKKDWEFHFKTGADGEFALYVGDRKVEISGGYYTADGRVPPPGKLHEWLRAMKEGRENLDMRVPMTDDMVKSDARLRKMDEFGVDGSMVYIGHMVAAVSYLDQIEPGNAVIHAYNQWMLDDWKFNYKDRIFTTPILNLRDLDSACKEAEWVIKNGARAVIMEMGPVNNRAPAHPYHDRFWSILNEAGIGVVYHVGEAFYMKDHMEVWGEPIQQSRLRQTAFVWMNGYSERPVVETLSSFIFMNFFERFPKVKLMSAENGAEWVPAMLTKMDKVRGMAKNGYWPCGQLKERPSKIFKRHVWVVAYPEDDLRQIIDLAGGNCDWLVMGSDYPHAEGVPTPKDFVTEACHGLNEQQIRGIMHDNGWSFINGR